MRLLDAPDESEGRKKHIKSVPVLGGAAIFITFFSVVFFLFFKGYLPEGYLHLRAISALFLGGIILVLGGILDERYHLPPSRQIIFPLLAAAISVFGGIHFTFIRNPFGGILPLDIWNLGFDILFPADLLSFLWIIGIIYTTKLLDGLDGLAVGVTAIAAVLIVALALRPELNQPQTVVLGVTLVSVLLGFLVWNFHPARIFLGESGSTLVGFLAGGLAIAAGSKVATTLLVLGVPILDVVAVILRRLRAGAPITRGGREHLHFRLLDAGLSHRGVVLFYYFFAAAFGGVSWFLGTSGKIATFIFLVILFIAISIWIERRAARNL